MIFSTQYIELIDLFVEMAQKEGELIAEAVIEEPASPRKSPNSFVEKWMHILPGSRNE